MSACAEKCLHADYCSYYGCPFQRDPQSSFAAVDAASHRDRAETVGGPGQPGGSHEVATALHSDQKEFLILKDHYAAELVTAAGVTESRSRRDTCRSGVAAGETAQNSTRVESPAYPSWRKQDGVGRDRRAAVDQIQAQAWLCRTADHSEWSENANEGVDDRKSLTHDWASVTRRRDVDQFSLTRTRAFRFGQQPDRISESWPAAGLRDQIVSIHGQQRLHLFLSRANAGCEAQRHRQKQRCVGPVSRPATGRSVVTSRLRQLLHTRTDQKRPMAATVVSAKAEREGWMTSAPFKTAYKCLATGSRGDGESRPISVTADSNRLGLTGTHQRYAGHCQDSTEHFPTSAARVPFGRVAGVCARPARFKFTSDAQQSRPEPMVNPIGHITRTVHTPAAAIALAKSASNSEVDGRVQNRISVFTRPTHSRGPDRSMDFGGETPTALEAAANRIGWVDIRPSACGESLASLLPRETIRIRRHRSSPLINFGEGGPRVTAASCAAEYLLVGSAA